MKETILSVGIDIGTSTTQLIFSRLTIENLASSYMVPRIRIVDKEVTYRSEIYFTPLLSQTEIDAEKVKGIIEREYRKAGMKPEDLQTGAVIITGETARKQNANSVLASLSSMAGDFVVATAGPDLESVLSAKGAGADRISEEKRIAVANIDIGGGTSNIALFQKGSLKGTSCLDIGGRLIKVENGRISYIYPKIQKLAERHGIRIAVGDRADESKSRHAAGRAEGRGSAEEPSHRRAKGRGPYLLGRGRQLLLQRGAGKCLRVRGRGRASRQGGEEQRGPENHYDVSRGGDHPRDGGRRGYPHYKC